LLRSTIHITLFLLIGISLSYGQTPQDSTLDAITIEIGNIYIAGNEKTREEIILRELDIKPGDLYKGSDFLVTLEKDRQKLINTQLFVTVELVPLMMSPTEADILIRLQERWYIFPVPIFRLADRNFTEWWVNQNRDFSRVNWGLQLFHTNLTGRNDRLTGRVQFGFTQQFAMRYSVPYIDKQQRLGISFGGSYATNKTIGITSSGQRQVFYGSEDVVRTVSGGFVSLIHRPSFYTRHAFDIAFNHTNAQDTVAQINPNYLGDGRVDQRYFRLGYTFTRDLRDFIAYPLSGSYLRLSANQFGLGIFEDLNMFTTRGSYGKYFDLGKEFFQANRLEVFKNWGDQIPYLNRSGFGYSPDFIRGYERFVVESDFLISYRTAIKWRFLEGVQNLNERSIIPQFRTLPYAFYFNIFMDVGFAGDPLLNTENNFLNNKMLASFGLGVDLVTYYDFVMRVEASINREGDTGFYFNFRRAL